MVSFSVLCSLFTYKENEFSCVYVRCLDVFRKEKWREKLEASTDTVILWKYHVSWVGWSSIFKKKGVISKTEMLSFVISSVTWFYCILKEKLKETLIHQFSFRTSISWNRNIILHYLGAFFFSCTVTNMILKQDLLDFFPGYKIMHTYSRKSGQRWKI